MKKTILILMTIMAIFLTGCNTTTKPADAIAPPPDYNDVFIYLEYDLPLTSEVRCYDDYSNNTRTFNHTFLFGMDYETTEEIDENIRYRIRYMELDYGYKFDENEEFVNYFIKLINETSYHHEVYCKTRILDNKNTINAKICDEGYCEDRKINLYEPLEILCISYYDEVGYKKPICEYKYDGTTYNQGLYWEFSKQVEKNVFEKLIRDLSKW